MKARLELESIQEALDIITKTAPPTSGNVNVISSKGKLRLITVADLSRCTVIVPCDVKGDAEFGISLQSLKDAIKNRKVIDLDFDKSVLNVKSSNYKAELATVDAIPVDSLEQEDIKEWQLGTEQATWLKKALSYVALKPTSIISSWMPVGIKLTSKSAFVACYDTQHMSWISSKEVTGDFECVIPIDTAIAIVDVFHKSTFKILHSKSAIEVRNKLVHVVLSVPSTDDLVKLDQVQAKIKEALAAKSSSVKIQKQDLLTFMDNAKSVLTKERAELSVAPSTKGYELTVKTVQGTVKNVIKGEGKAKFKIDYEYIQELVSKADANIELAVVDSAFLSMKLQNSTAIVALNQE